MDPPSADGRPPSSRSSHGPGSGPDHPSGSAFPLPRPGGRSAVRISCRQSLSLDPLESAPPHGEVLLPIDRSARLLSDRPAGRWYRALYGYSARRMFEATVCRGVNSFREESSLHRRKSTPLASHASASASRKLSMYTMSEMGRSSPSRGEPARRASIASRAPHRGSRTRENIFFTPAEANTSAIRSGVQPAVGG